MRPLNRPMFRYGGPIKEGIMDGIREPKKNGGPTGTGLVGDQRYPKTDGREHHFAVIPPILAAGSAALRFLPAAYRGFKASRAYTPMSKNLGVGGRLKDIFLPKKGLSAGSIQGGSTASRAKYMKDTMAPIGRGEGAGYKVGSFLRRNPITTASLLPQAAAGTYAVSSGAVKAVPGIAKAYIDALIPGESIFREKDGSPKTDASGVSNINKTKAAIGMPENLTYRASTDASKKGGGVELSAEERRKNQIQKYRDIMDIKGMNKKAAYDSLIDASRLISESGDFKGDIKSGKLINQIIQATNKQFDKPSKTKDAIDTLILKGEIEKDIKASDPLTQLDARYKRAKIAESEKSLNPSYNTLVAINTKAGAKGQAVFDGAAKDFSDNRGEIFRGNLISKSDFKDILTDLKKNPETQNADDVTIIATWTQGELDSSKKNIPDGNYTVGDRVVTIKDKIVVDVN